MYREEYPRPELVRDSFINLNGEWQFEPDMGLSGKEKRMLAGKFPQLNGKIELPFCPESKLSGVCDTDFHNACWYQRTVNITKNANERTIMHFGAAFRHTELYVNEKYVGFHDGGYTSFEFDITEYVTDGDNLFTVYCEGDCRKGEYPSGKQCGYYKPKGCYYTRTTGIWQTVWLEYVPVSYIKRMKFDSDIDSGTLSVRLDSVGTGMRTIRLAAYYDGKKIAASEISTSLDTAFLSLHIDEENLHLWSPDSPCLYDLTAELVCGESEDFVRSYFGMRKVEFDSNGLKINGRYIFMRTVLDQGYYPDGIITAPSDDALRRDILMSKRMGFNGARLHQKVFEPRFLWHCDREGYLVWGEYPSWGMEAEAKNLPLFLGEWLEAVERDYNHPSIIGWCPLNEVWSYAPGRDAYIAAIYKETKRFDPYRPVIDASGGIHVSTDIYDTHDYEQNVDIFRERYGEFTEGKIYDGLQQREVLKYDPKMPYFLSEYGGFRWSDKDSAGWGYGKAPESVKEYADRYISFAKILLENPRICGLCYTQLYDVESEQNGIFFYSRENKFDEKMLDDMAAAMSGEAALEKLNTEITGK